MKRSVDFLFRVYDNAALPRERGHSHFPRHNRGWGEGDNAGSRKYYIPINSSHYKGVVQLLFCMAATFLSSCKEDDISLFDKTPDERSAEAIAALKEDLTDPIDGWKMNYRPVDEAGAYFVLLDFGEDNKVTIKSDLSADDGEYFSQTITYRIDNSLGLELIFENYSFFSFLFEQDQATFGAEFEFKYVNKTPDNALVFTSKSDVSDPSIITLEVADPSDDSLLGYEVAENLSVISDDLPNRFSSSLQMIYESKDLVFFTSLDQFRRIFTVSQASNKSNLLNAQAVDFSSGYIIQGNSIVLDTPLDGTFLGNAISVSSIQFNALTDATINVCADPAPVHGYTAVTSQGDVVELETSLIDINGATFTNSDFYFCPLSNIRRERLALVDEITTDVAGALEFHLYYGLPLTDTTSLYGIGFVIENNDGSITFALREFTPVLTDNNIVFNFEPDITLFGNQQTDANVQNINTYLDALTQGNTTYVFEYAEDLYEFHNPCTGWSFVFINAN